MSDVMREDEAPEAAPPPTTETPQPGLPQDLDLDTLLAEYERETTASAPEAVAELDPLSPEALLAPEEDPDPASTNLREFQAASRMKMEALIEQRQLQLARDREDLFHHIEIARAQIPELSGASDATVAALLAGAYQTSERVQTAWEGRHENPTIWRNEFSRLLGSVGRDLANRIDPDATEDREAVAAAVRGGSGSPPPEAAFPNSAQLSTLSDKQFADFAKSVTGADVKLA